MPAQSSSFTKFDFGNSSFDISPLSLRNGWYGVQDGQNNMGSRNYTYYLNFGANIDPANLPYLAALDCNVTVPGSGYLSPATFASVPAYQYANPSIRAPTGDKCHRLGSPVSGSTMSWGLYDSTNPSRGVWVQYNGGDRCPGTSLYRSLRVWMLCYDDATNIPDDEVVLETSNCAYEIFIKSAFGCPVQCPLPAGDGGSSRQLCSGHGVCDFDASMGNSRCFCNPGFDGDDCSGVAAGPATGLSTAGGVLIGVSVFLALTLGFLAYLWFFKIARLRLDPTAYSALRAGPEDAPGASPTVQ